MFKSRSGMLRHCIPVSVLLLMAPAPPARDSDLAITCGSEFAVFDRFEGEGRMLHVVPWVTEGELEISGSVLMRGSQPHAWAIYDDNVVVRSWNDFYIYRVDEQYHPDLIFSGQIDDSRPDVGGTTSIQLSESVLTVFGVGRTIVLDLDTCDQGCATEIGPVVSDPPVQRYPGECEVHKGDQLFAVSVGTTRGRMAFYHDMFLTRRRTDPSGRRVLEAFSPESMLYLGTRIETGG